MPSAIEYVAPTEVARNHFSGAISRERLTRRRAYRTALEYYLGEHPSQLEVEADAPDDNTTINLVKMTAERTVSFLFPTVPKFVVDGDTIDETPEELWLKEAFISNGGLNLLTKIGLRGFLAGHNFIRVKEVPERFSQRKNYYPKIVSLDPTSIGVYWRADDIADVIWYEYRYAVADTVYIKDFVHDEENDVWKIYTYKSIGTKQDGTWNDISTHHGSSSYPIDNLDFNGGNFELVETEVHSIRIPPIIEFPHLPHPDDYYGLDEVSQSDLQDTINRIASERNRIVRENSDPIDVLIGADPQDVEGDGGFFTIGNLGAKVQRLEMRGDLSGVTTTLDKMIETYLAIARVVLLKGEAKDLQRVTNASVRTLFLDSIAKNKILQENYGWALSQLCSLMLAMGFKAGQLQNYSTELKVAVKFAEPLPHDELEIAQVNAIGTKGGWMDKATAATRMGMDWAEVKPALDAEYEENLARQPIVEETDTSEPPTEEINIEP